MQWGGSLGPIPDATTKTSVNVRAFGAFEGTIAHPGGEAILQPLLLEAVRAATAQYVGPVLALDRQKEAIAHAAMALLAARLHELGAVGALSITAFSFDPEDHERLQELSRKAAFEHMAARRADAEAPAAAVPVGHAAQAPLAEACTNCGAPAPGKFCRECGTPRAAAAAAPVGPGRTITRPPGGGAIASVVRGPFPPGSSVVVEEGFSFFAVGHHGAIELPSGAHAALETCELGVFVRTVGLRIRAVGLAGQVFDATRTPRDVRAMLAGKLTVDDPVALAQALGDRELLEDTSLRTEVQSGLLVVARTVVKERFGSGAWPLAMLEDFENTWHKPVAAFAEIGPTIAAAYLASSPPLRGLTLMIDAATLTFAAGEPAAEASAPEQAPVAAPVAAAGGVRVGSPVLVQWSDRQRYPGVARESRNGQVLVAFPNGGLQWIPAQFVSPGST